jgi:hypothetical protein
LPGDMLSFLQSSACVMLFEANNCLSLFPIILEL